MFRQLFTFCGALLLVGTALFMTTGQAAARGGGGHGGGFGGHGGGGFHAGGFHAGGYHGGYGGYHYGGYHGAYHYGYPHSRFYGYGGYPYYYDYGTYSSDYPYYYSMNNPYYWSGGGAYTDSTADVYDSSTPPDGPSAPNVPEAPVYPDGYTSGAVTEENALSNSRASVVPPAPAAQPARPDYRAHVTVRVPAGAEVWFDDHRTTKTGTLRQYQSPSLTPGEKYSYDIRARWQEKGREVTQNKTVSVTAGSHADVQFPLTSTR
jgi:uncharacterized protein (TIGR03000 family)